MLEILLQNSEFKTDHPHCYINHPNTRIQTPPHLEEERVLFGSDLVRLYEAHQYVQYSRQDSAPTKIGKFSSTLGFSGSYGHDSKATRPD